MASLEKQNKKTLNFVRTQQRRMGKDNPWNLHCKLPRQEKSLQSFFLTFTHFPLQWSGERRPLIFCFHLWLPQEFLWLQTIRPDWHFYSHSCCTLQKGNWAVQFILLVSILTTSPTLLLSGLYPLKTLTEVCLIRDMKHFPVTG